MERREFLKVTLGFAAGVAALAASAQAAPLMPRAEPLEGRGIPPDMSAAVASPDDLDNAHVEQVRWGRHRGWGHRRWGFRRRRRFWGYRRRWHRRRFWGFRRRHWHRRWHRRRYW